MQHACIYSQGPSLRLPHPLMGWYCPSLCPLTLFLVAGHWDVEGIYVHERGDMRNALFLYFLKTEFSMTLRQYPGRLEGDSVRHFGDAFTLVLGTKILEV